MGYKDDVLTKKDLIDLLHVLDTLFVAAESLGRAICLDVDTALKSSAPVFHDYQSLRQRIINTANVTEDKKDESEEKEKK